MLSSLLIASYVVVASFAHPNSPPWIHETGPSSETEEAWTAFKINYGKTFEDENEERAKKKTFAENLKAINENNDLYSIGLKTFTMKINQFADMNQSEFLNLMTGYEPPEDLSVVSTSPMDHDNLVLPHSLDWRTKGYVTGVKNQGGCASCWAFSATGALEGQHFREKGKLVSLSEQQLIDCSKNNNGCKSGWPSSAFDYIARNRGIDEDNYYPYTGRNGLCHYNRTGIGASCRSFEEYRTESEHQLQSLTVRVGPVSVAIDASHKSFQLYNGGVYYEPLCKNLRLNHATLVVGYGEDHGGDYWIVKNSWGTNWGMAGYILMARNRNNNCGIASRFSYPIV